MITEQDLQEAIAECEGKRNPSSDTCVKLAAFYAIKDRMYPQRTETAQKEPAMRSATNTPSYSFKAENEANMELTKALSEAEPATLVTIMEELLETLQVVSPRIYDGVVRKLSEL